MPTRNWENSLFLIKILKKESLYETTQSYQKGPSPASQIKVFSTIENNPIFLESINTAQYKVSFV
jgi:hypothetical protein